MCTCVHVCGIVARFDVDGCPPGVRARLLLRWLYLPLALQASPPRPSTSSSSSGATSGVGACRSVAGRCESCLQRRRRAVEAAHTGDGWSPLHRAVADAAGEVVACLVAAVGLERQATAARLLWRRTHDEQALSVLDVAALMVQALWARAVLRVVLAWCAVFGGAVRGGGGVTACAALCGPPSQGARGYPMVQLLLTLPTLPLSKAPGSLRTSLHFAAIGGCRDTVEAIVDVYVPSTRALRDATLPSTRALPSLCAPPLPLLLQLLA